jgi:hypothetical protein
LRAVQVRITSKSPATPALLKEHWMTRAIAALLEIMSDADAPLRRRIEATEGLLAYEAPQEAVDQAKAFLTSVFEDAEQRVDDRLDALKLMRKAEARKITAPTVTAEDARANRELWRDIEMGVRRVAMIKAGVWEHAPKDWAADLLSENYVEPSGLADDALRSMLGIACKN